MQRPSFLHKAKYEAHAVLAAVSSRYSPLPGRSSTRYSPVRHFTRARRRFHVRLACVKHAASVQSEPESNSPVQICSRSLLGRNQNLKVVLFPFALRLSMNQADLRPSPFLAALGCMNLFRGAVNNFFCKLRKNFCGAFSQSSCDNRRRRKIVFPPSAVNAFFAVCEIFPRPADASSGEAPSMPKPDCRQALFCGWRPLPRTGLPAPSACAPASHGRPEPGAHCIDPAGAGR